jgi:hypothetical protein
VEHQQSQPVTRATADVGRVEQLAKQGFGARFIARSLAVHQGDGEVQPSDGPIRRQIPNRRERLDRAVEIELTHEADGAVVLLDECGSDRGARLGAASRQRHGGHDSDEQQSEAPARAHDGGRIP